jgi:hypothetical protein
MILTLGHIFQQNEFLIFWITLSLSVGYLFHYLLAQKTILPKRLRDQFLVTSLKAFGLTCLCISVLFLSLKGALDADAIHTTPEHWWLAWILGLLSIVLCWLNPWETHRWLCFAIFGHGIFFSPSLEPAIWLTIGWSVIKIVSSIPVPQKISFKKLKPGMVHLTALLVFLALASFQAFSFHSVRAFRPSWISLVKEIHASPEHGYLVIGEGSSFVAHFSAAKFIEDPLTLTLTSEDELIERLHNEAIDSIIVDGRFVRDFWRRWIKEDNDAETSNKSVITRLISDGGKEIRIRTLNLNAIKKLKVTKLQSLDFFLIEFAKPD